MKATYWYFTFEISNEETGYTNRDHAVAASNDDNFPLDLVLTYGKEEFGDAAKVVISSPTRISFADYKRHCAKIVVFQK